MTRRLRVSCAALAITTLLAACGGDTTQPGDKLSAQQVQTMASALSALLAISTIAQDPSVVPPAHVSARTVSAETFPITGSRTCPEGGHIGVDGTFTLGDGGGSSLYTISDTLVDCGIRGNDSNVWTFTTQPTLEVSIVQGYNGDSTEIGDSTGFAQLNFRQTDVGRLNYTSESLSGSCAVDLVVENKFTFLTPTADSATISLHTTGTLCERSVERDTSVTIFVPAPS
jgi:hypothetical protein